MRIIFRIALATLIGVVVGILLPSLSPETMEVLLQIEIYVHRIMSLLLMPLIVTGVAIGVFELLSQKKLFYSVVNYSVLSLVTTLVFTTIAAVTVYILVPDQVPMVIESAIAGESFSARSITDGFLPPSLIGSAISGEGAFLTASLILAVIISVLMRQLKSQALPLLEPLSLLRKGIFQANGLLLKIIFPLVTFFAVLRIVQLEAIGDIDLYRHLFMIVALNLVLVLFVFPVLIYALGKRKNPLPWLLESIPELLLALVSGNINSTLPMMYGVSKRNKGQSRSSGDTLITLGAVFSRVGTAMVSSMGFMLILRSYSLIDVSFAQFAWVVFMSFGLSLVASPFPGSGVVVLITQMAAMYGRGIEESFLILTPLFPILIAIATFIDALAISAMSYAVGTTVEDIKTPIESEMI